MLLLGRGSWLRILYPRRRRHPAILIICVFRLIALLLLLQPSADAGNKTWKNTGTDFNTGSSWSPAGVPGSSDVALFSGAMVTQPNLSASLTILELYFSGTSTSGYDITSSSTSIKLTLTNTGTGTTSAIDAGNTSGTNTIDAPIILGAAGGSTETFSQASAGTLVINGVISSTSSVTLSLAGSGIITLAGANTYSGGTTLANGTTLRINNATALGTGTFTINGGIIDNTTAGAITLSNNNAQTWNGDFTFTGTQSLNMGIGAISLGTTAGTTRTITVNGSTLTEGGIISNGTTANSLTKAGTGTLTLTGANAYTGTTTINAGVLNIQNATGLGTTASGTTVASGATLQLQGSITVGAEAFTISGIGASGQNGALVNVSGTNNYGGLLTLGAATTISSDSGTLNLTNTGTITGSGFNLTLTGAGSGTVSSIIGTGSGAVVKASTGTWTLTGANTYTGTTTISAGILNIQNATALGTTASGTTVTSGATLQLQGGITVGAEALTISGTGASGQNGALVNVSGTNNYNGLLTLGTATTISSDSGTLNFTNAGTITGATFGLTLTGSGSGTISSIIGTTSGTLTKSGTGTWTLSGADTFTGATTISAGILNIQNASALGTTASGTTISSGATLQLQGGITVGAEALTISGTGAGGQNGALVNVSGTNNYAGLLVLGAATTISSDSGTLNFTNTGTITGPTFGLTLAGAGSGTISSIIGTTTGSLTKSGSGTWTLSGVNTYAGATTINAGTLNVSGSLASGSAITVNNSGSMLEGTGTIFGSVSIASSGAILEAGTGSTGQTLTMRGAVTMGSGSIIALALGASGAHSTLAIGAGGSISFQSLQKFNIIDLGVTAGSTYTGLITGLGSNPGTESSWTIANQYWAYNFSYDSANGGEIDLTVTALPEPSPWIAAGLALAALIYYERRRFTTKS